MINSSVNIQEGILLFYFHSRFHWIIMDINNLTVYKNIYINTSDTYKLSTFKSADDHITNLYFRSFFFFVHSVTHPHLSSPLQICSIQS